MWQFRLDTEKKGITCHYEIESFTDTIRLPGTVSEAQKGTPQNLRETGFLTDPYRMEGYCWYQKTVDLPLEHIEELFNWQIFLSLERTRISYLWVDGTPLGSFDSFVSTHRYDLTPYIHSLHPVITIMVSNTGYKVPGGHLTSADTQTNWNGILGDLTLSCYKGFHISHADAVSNVTDSCIELSVAVKFF